MCPSPSLDQAVICTRVMRCAPATGAGNTSIKAIKAIKAGLVGADTNVSERGGSAARPTESKLERHLCWDVGGDGFS
jgi:hypothetical protein